MARRMVLALGAYASLSHAFLHPHHAMTTVARPLSRWTSSVSLHHVQTCSLGTRHLVSMAATAEPATWKTPGYRRPLHWVFKIGDLKKSLDFYEKELGMHVHRHEEFASGCEATCNGPYGGAWSKTMCGYGTEDKNFALELTANYGVDSYDSGNDYRYIAVDSRVYKGPDSSVQVSPEGQKFATSPDGYKFLLVDTGKSGDVPEEPFLFVSINVADLEKSVKYYTEVLGAKVFSGLPGALGTPGSVLLGFNDQGVKLELVKLPGGQTVDHKLASGRFATETEDGAPDYVGNKVKTVGGTILHGPLKLQPHGEEVVIVTDPDGYEHCFVDARGYKNCVDVGSRADGKFVNWEYRQKLDKAARSGAKAKYEVAKVLAGDYDKKAVQAKIAGIIKEPCVVFAQTTCPYCKKAKDLLTSLGANYKVVDVDALGTEGYAVRVELAELTGRSSVPNIFIGGQGVGGFTDGPGVETLQKEGKLLPELQKAGAL